MTPHPPSEHPDLDVLADLAEELLPPEQAEPLHHHLAGCPSCAEDYAALRGLPELLADTPAPPMPQDIADRLTAALAAESAARTETHPEDRTEARTDDRPERPAAGPSGPPRTGGPAGSPRAASGPGRRERRRRRALSLLLATAAVAVVATLGGVLLSRNAPSSTVATTDSGKAVPQPTAADASRPKPNVAGSDGPNLTAGSGGPDFTADQLPAQIHALLATKPVAGLSPADAGNGPAACALSAAGHPGEPPLTAGTGSYQGRPVLALVFRPPGGSGPLDVYLATPDCPGSTILLHSTVPAP
ncbi:anti-sigma factor family protein [Kitasatospora sp. NPDC004615]|uniref:anti-sigma factor family protein n=1 Tax=Kitasatospora sp. NPDC004615 TaxID=3364017 RepID=UPI003687FEE3